MKYWIWRIKMNNALEKDYNKIIEEIKNDKKTKSILLVGSSKDKNFKEDKINDVDVFVFSNIKENQTRKVIQKNEISFDINYFSENGIESLIKNREYFFIKEMKNPKIIYNSDYDILEIINKCEKLYNNGPGELSIKEKELLSITIKDKIDTLKNKDKTIESIFLTNLYLKDIISGYFITNNKWIPKDKKIFYVLEKQDLNLYKLIINKSEKTNYEYLLDIYNYVFQNIKNQGG